MLTVAVPVHRYYVIAQVVICFNTTAGNEEENCTKLLHFNLIPVSVSISNLQFSPSLKPMIFKMMAKKAPNRHIPIFKVHFFLVHNQPYETKLPYFILGLYQSFAIFN